MSSQQESKNTNKSQQSSSQFGQNVVDKKNAVQGQPRSTDIQFQNKNQNQQNMLGSDKHDIGYHQNLIGGDKHDIGYKKDN